MFKARTNQSGKLKALFEVLFSNAQDVMLTISKTGIETELPTLNNATIRVTLPAGSFEKYEYTYDEPMYVGLGAHVNAYFKSIKKKTAITLAIEKPLTLDVLLNYDDHDATYSVTLTCAQNISPAPTYEYDLERCFVINTSTFSSMCKSFSKTSTVDVKKLFGQLFFSFELSGIASRSSIFGKYDDAQQQMYFEKFKSDSFIRLEKLASFANKLIKVCVEKDSPLMILAESSLGVIKVTMSPNDTDN
jgi:hypothetical protein